MNLGGAQLRLEARGGALGGQQHAHAFEVQEFRRPEFEVKAAASEGPFLVGGAATVTVTAAYYAGGALPGAEVSVARGRDARHVPPAEPGRLRLRRRSCPGGTGARDPREPGRVETMAARTDGSGVHRLRIDFDRGDPPRPHVVRAEATVMDVNRQAWTAGADLLVHPSERYVGLRTERAFVQKGEPIAIDAIATDLEGGAVAGRPLRLRAERLDWEQVEGEWKEVPKDVQEREVPSAAEPVRVALRGEGGRRVARRRPRRRRAGPRERDGAPSLGGRRAGAAPPRPRGGEGDARPRPEGVPGGRRGEGARARALRPRRGRPDPAPQRPRARGALHDRRRLAHARDPDRGRLHPQRARPGGPRGAGAPRGGGRGGAGGGAVATGLRQRQPRPPGPARGAHARPHRDPAREGARLPAARPCSTSSCATPPADRWRTARPRSWWWTRPCWPSPATASRTRSTSSTPGAGPTSPTTGSAPTSCSRGRRS